MANNRMWLINTRTGDKVLLAKYFPSGGWNLRSSPQALTELLDAENAHNAPGTTGIAGLPIAGGGMYGGNPWRLEYEMGPDE